MQYDVIVIGGGPGGYVAAVHAASKGKKVAIVEKADLGGICLNWGCIPTKALLRSAEIFASVKKAASFGIQVDAEKATIDYPKVIQRSREVAGKLSKQVAALMKLHKIDTIFGTAKLASANQVNIELRDGGYQTVTAEHIILATGARTREFPSMKIDGERVWGSRHALEKTVFPKSIAIVGGGAIGVEFAYFFQTLGSEVTLIEMLPHILPQEDEDIVRELTRAFKKQGMQILTETKIEKIESLPDGASLLLKKKDNTTETMKAEYVLVAVGVQGNIENLGLEEVGVKTEKGWIQVNEYYQTSIPNIYAIGDVTGAPWLAHVASAEGIIAVHHLTHDTVTPLDRMNIPSCIYSHPQVASVGYTEKKAIEAGYTVKIGKFPLRACGKAVALGEEEGMVKMVFDAKGGKILGCHIIAAEATELISEIVLARTAKATYAEILHAVHPHPTLSEIISEATWNGMGH